VLAKKPGDMNSEKEGKRCTAGVVTEVLKVTVPNMLRNK
jgi:hypothetical protein